MTKVAIIRCEKNETRCPLTNCLKCLSENKEGLPDTAEVYRQVYLPAAVRGDNIADLAKILKSKGAEAIHFCTCTFANKTDKGWVSGEGGFCDHVDRLIEEVHTATGLPCVKGTAHLPKDYEVEIRR